MHPPRTLLTWVGPALLVALVGCGGGGPKVVKVTGTLTYKGQPVPDALLHFAPEKGRQGWAQTDEKGRFKVNYDRHQDGAVVGKHKVWLEYRPSHSEAEPGMPAKTKGLSKEMKEVFAKYSQARSNLEVTIERAGDIKIELN